MMLLAHGPLGICPLELMAILPGLGVADMVLRSGTWCWWRRS